MTNKEKQLLQRLKGMVESYEIALETLKDSVASGVVRGEFMTEIKEAQQLIKEVKEIE